MKHTYIIIYLLFFILPGGIFAQTASKDTTHVRVHDKVDMTWYGSYNQFAEFPDGSQTYEKIILKYTMGCASNGCSDWDYTTNIYIVPDFYTDSSVSSFDTIQTNPLIVDTNWNYSIAGTEYEIARAITPYGGYMANNSQGYNNDWEHTFLYDVTDYAHMLKDSVYVKAFYSGWSSGFSVTLDFEFIEGIPPRNVISIDNVYMGSFSYHDTQDFQDNVMPPKTMSISEDMKTAKLKVLPSGHAFDNNLFCAEFCVLDYFIFIDGNFQFSESMWRDDCGLNNVYPQGGTWLLDRANWCPGDKVFPFEHEIGSLVTAGEDVEINFDVEPYTWTGPQTPVHIVTVQLIQYGEPTLNLDAELLDILKPSNHDRYMRMNPICANPAVKIRNRGKESLNSLLIEYGIEGETPCYYLWEGSLEFLETAVVELPNFNWPEDSNHSHIFYAEISYPNNKIDGYDANNFMSTPFETVPVLPDEFVINMRTNQRPEENAFFILNDAGDTVVQKTQFDANTVYNETVQLDPGCYTFLLTDSGKDGLSYWANQAQAGSGFIRFRNTNNSLLRSFNPDFGTEIRYNFTVGIQGGNSGFECEKPEIEISSIFETSPTERLNIFPNPSDGIINIQSNNLESFNGIMRLYNLNGKKLMSQFLDIQKFENKQVNVTGLPDGMYILEIQSEKDIFQQKLIIRGGY
ncbi:MAG: T9SS C-terminal target domain-containing protein [Chitinophagaceae bacterium]|nr:MAG: T9SS C-terminal target domain-containing protein [Chitinophagaceae bacterium]